MTFPHDPTLALILNATLPLLHLAYEQVVRIVEAALDAYGANAPAGLPELLENLRTLGKDGGGRAELKRLLADAMARDPEAADPTSQVIAAILAALAAVDSEVEPGAEAAPNAAAPSERGDTLPPNATTTSDGPARFDPFTLTRKQLVWEVLRVLAIDPSRHYTRQQIARYLVVQKGGLGEREVNLLSQRFSDALQELKRRHWVTSKGPHNQMGFAISESGRAALAGLSSGGNSPGLDN
jgi:hypothetical protein